ncbi:MAG: glycosyl transferase family 1 [Azospirillum brasilense]|nr:MAG: glycosyl transferase family 1 [Azospirillum brasilense]
MKLLFLHPNMPGQYKHLARAFGEEGGHEIYFVTKHRTAEIPGVTRVTYDVKHDTSAKTHRYLRLTERAAYQGQAAWRACHALKAKGFTPDVIIAHPGWGDTLFLRDLFPQARILHFCEFYYRAHGTDVGFDPAEAPNDDDLARLRLKNITNLAALDSMDWGIAPTVWQWSLHPDYHRDRISVLHDGVDTTLCAPAPGASFTTPSGRTFTAGDPVITYIARNFEPYRGFPTFMQAAELILRERPECHIIAVGADDVSYGKSAGANTTYRSEWLKKVNLPEDRIHFVGTVPYDQLLNVFRVSRAHLYLTYPFVLSWSMLEAMATGVALVGSRTAPVMEVVEHGTNGLLADFFSPRDVADKLLQLYDAPDGNAAMRAAARQSVVDRFALEKLLPLHMQLVRELAAGQVPPPVAQAIAQVSPIAPYAQVAWNAQR